MVQSKELYYFLSKHVGEKYVLGAQVPKTVANFKGPWDCAEFIAYGIYQLTKKYFGVGHSANNTSYDAYTGYFDNDAKRTARIVQIEQAANTIGALLIRVPKAGAIGHIVCSDGMGGTIEAHSSKDGVIKSTVQNRRWDYGILVPFFDYSTVVPTSLPVKQPGIVYRLTDPLMKGERVEKIQSFLNSKGYGIQVDGYFGADTVNAVASFQNVNGLVADGEVGEKTLKVMGLLS